MPTFTVQGREYPFPTNFTLGELSIGKRMIGESPIPLIRDGKIADDPDALQWVARVVKDRAGETFDPAMLAEIWVTELGVEDDADPPVEPPRAAESGTSATTLEASGGPQ